MLEEVCEVIADVQLEGPGDRIDHRESGVGMDLLEEHGTALLATAVHAWEAAATERGSRSEARSHRDVNTETHDRYRQLLPVEVLVVAAPPLAQLRVEIDVGEADGARQEPSVLARQ